MNIAPIPQTYIDQAVRPRGATVNERLDFLLNWYVNTCEKNDASWAYQRSFLDTMGRFGVTLRPILMREDNEATRQAIVDFLPVVDEFRATTRHAHDAAFFAYLHVELTKVIG